MRKYIIIAMLLTSCGPAGNQGNIGNPGPQGPIGATGATGDTGAQGPAGADGTVIIPVQFCPGTPSYPSTFPEYGLCINNQLYAVYSTHGGFLTVTPPGVYTSNAVGSKCDFKILDNCVVQAL